MWEQLMNNLRPNELELLREVITNAYNDRWQSLQGEDADHDQVVPASIFHRAIEQIDSNM